VTTLPEDSSAASSDAVDQANSVEEAERPARRGSRRMREKQVHEVVFVTYPKLLFIWPLILAGLVFYPFGAPQRPISASVAAYEAARVSQSADTPASDAVAGEPARNDEAEPAKNDEAEPEPADPFASNRLEVLGWAYIWVVAVVLLTLGIDIGRNQAAFWVVLVAAIWVLGLWLHDAKGFTIFGDIYRWFAGLNVQYNRSLALALSIIMLVPYLIMIGWAYINDRWRITHNEFEHYSFGKMDDSLGRGAKTIRTSFPDVLELLLGMAGTLIVYNATGTKELRRIPHVMFLPFIRKRLNKILEKTAITAGQMEEEEENDEDQ
jgi:hypothetical protein